MVIENRKTCQECGQILAGRIDKKFCDSDCRTNYHNRTQRIASEKFRLIERAMKRNRNFLQRRRQEGWKFISVLELRDCGFDLKYFTHLVEDPKGRVWRYVYDEPYSITKYGIMILPPPKFGSNNQLNGTDS